MNNVTYDLPYNTEKQYWGQKPSNMCYEVLKLLPPTKKIKLLDIGCGEGQNALFFARNGYDVSAFDISSVGVNKTIQLAKEVGIKVNAFVADVNKFQLEEQFDVIFSSGVLHYIPQEKRSDIFSNFKNFTSRGGIHVLHTFVEKPFIALAPDAEEEDQKWVSGELFSLYHDWIIKSCSEDIKDCNSSGVPHQHASNRLIAKKP